MFASSSAAASSRVLLVRSCRRRLPSHQLRFTPPEAIRCNFNANSVRGKKYCNYSHAAFSTIPFDGNAFDTGASSSSASVDSQSSLNASPTTVSASRNNDQHSAQSQSIQQFQQQIQQWISTNPKIAPYKAEEALARLWVEQQEIFQQWAENQQKSNIHGSDVSPTILLTTESVNIVLQAWCYSDKGEIAAQRAERLLHWMEDLHYSSDITTTSDTGASHHASAWSAYLPKPNYQSYATVIDAWSRAAVYESTHPSPANSSNTAVTETKSGGRAKSNVVSQSTKSGFDCARRAEELLMHMQRMHEEQQQMYEQSGQEYHSEIQPDTRVFNMVLKAWSRIHGGTKASAIRAMRILDLMQELHHYQSKDASEWQGIVMSKVQPNLQTYKSVLYAWAHATHTVEGPDRAEEILRHLLSLSKAGNMGIEIMPDTESFHIVMKAHAESVRKRRKGDDGTASVERAQKINALLDWMELMASRNTKSKVKPTTESYRIALSAWVWSHHVDAPKEAEDILYRMIRAYDANKKAMLDKNKSSLVQPETRDFNTLINCCSFARKVGVDKDEEDDESLLERQLAHQEIYNIAEGALDTLLASSYATPDSATFSGIIRACVNLLPNTDDRDDRVIKWFRLAYQTSPSAEGAASSSAKISSTSSERMRAPPGAGCVDANVLRQLRHALPSTEDYIRVREEFEEYRRQNAGEE